VSQTATPSFLYQHTADQKIQFALPMLIQANKSIPNMIYLIHRSAELSATGRHPPSNWPIDGLMVALSLSRPLPNMLPWDFGVKRIDGKQA